MDITAWISLLGGVALFLFGMSFMGEGLKHVSGSKLELILFRLSNTPLKGFLLGAGVTAVIQSSCATSAMTVGFVNSGMMKLKQAISVIYGAILGTSITGWIVCLSYLDNGSGISSLLSTAVLTGVIAVIGVGLRMFAKKQSAKYIGDIMMGFAILMFGMSTMSGSVSSLSSQPWFTGLLSSMGNPILGIAIGAAFTALLQSASAAVGIVQALSLTGAFTFESSLPLLMGIAIGASLPVLLLAIGAKADGKRSAAVYLISVLIGVMLFSSVYYISGAIFEFPFVKTVMDPFKIALVNTLLRAVIVGLLLPLMNPIEFLVKTVIKDKDKNDNDPALRLEERFLEYPVLALEQSRNTIKDMAEISKNSLIAALDLLEKYSSEGFEKVKALEAEADRYEDCIGSYLLCLTGKELSDSEGREVSLFMHTLSDFERISDHALNIAESAKEMHDAGITIDQVGGAETSVLFKAVREVTSLAIGAFIEGDITAATHVEPLEEVIDGICDQIKLHHVETLQSNNTIRQIFVFNDLTTNLERVSDHCSNIAVAMIELNVGAFDTHEYLDRLKEKRTPEYETYLAEFREKYAL